MERPAYQRLAEIRHTQSLPRFKTRSEKPKNRAEKLLGYVADVRSGEGSSALLLTINIFLLLFA